jgi:hypothetical protein
MGFNDCGGWDYVSFGNVLFSSVCYQASALTSAQPNQLVRMRALRPGTRLRVRTRHGMYVMGIVAPLASLRNFRYIQIGRSEGRTTVHRLFIRTAQQFNLDFLHPRQSMLMTLTFMTKRVTCLLSVCLSKYQSLGCRLVNRTIRDSC